MEENARSVIEFYVLNNKLKDVIRTGWKNWHVKRERVESIAEHVFGTISLAIAMHSQYKYDIDLEKVIFMLAIHELEETIIGDLTLWDISDSDKKLKGHEAVNKVLSGLISKEKLTDLILEFDDRKTKEAIFAYHIDKLECDLQCKLYGEEKCVNLNEQQDNKIYYDKRVQELLESEHGDWSKMWLEYDRHRYNDDFNFMEVLDYAKNNDIKKRCDNGNNIRGK